MPDLSNPSPLIMTHFEQIATLSAVFALCLAIVLDFWRARRAAA